jgi:FkbM family methyltransferase
MAGAPETPDQVNSRNKLMKLGQDYAKRQPRAEVRMPDGRAFKFVTPSGMTGFRVATLATKEPETIEWLDGLTASDILYDVGANIGLYSIYGAVSKGCRVYAFEPESQNFGLLNQNIALNELNEVCTPYCVGLSDTEGFTTIMVSPGESGSSGHQVQGAAAGSFRQGGVKARSQGIFTTTLDRLVDVHGFPVPTHIKVDVDGLEHAIVAGGAKVLSNPILRSVMIELTLTIRQHGGLLDAIEAFGFQRDAEMEAIVRAKTQGNAHSGNVLFTRKT